jgi:GT2 family glycosyltransferase
MTTEPRLPGVSLIVLNYNGRDHLANCFDSVASQDYAPGRLELILVDNASTDGSAAWMRQNYPQVRIIESAENLGFGAGNNLGAQAATGELLAFANNDMRLHPRFVREMVAARGDDPTVAAVGALILDRDGKRVDFGGAGAHFAGYAYQLGHGQPAEQVSQDIVPLLFPCGGAMLIDRQVYLDGGGFDGDYFALYEDLDLGWRLWVQGYRVVFAPKAIAYHFHHGTLNKFADYRKQVLYRRNALATVIKNYSDENLGRVLPAVLLGTVSGLVEGMKQRGHLDPAAYRIQSDEPARATVAVDRLDASTLVALDEIRADLPRLMEKRRQVQARRQRSDEEIAGLFRRPFAVWPDVSAQTQYALAEAFGLLDLFESTNRRVLVISSDILPYPGLPTVGSGLRAWSIGQGLASRGHEVVFSMPRAALRGREAQVPPEVLELAWENHTLLAVIRAASPDVVVVCNWPVLANIPTEHLGIPVVLDQHGPHYMEREYQKAGTTEENTHYKLQALGKADFFTCAGYKQLPYFHGWLERAGWSDEEREANAAAMPVSLSPNLPERSPDTETSFVYGGVFLPWQDPAAGLSAVVEALERHGRGRLYFYGGRHPVYPVDPGIYEPLLERLKQSPYVTAPGMVSHDDLIERYTRAHVAIDVMQRNPERELAFTTRTVEYLWCGLPVIYHDYAELSDYIREYEAGWTVDPQDAEALRCVLDTVFTQPDEVARRSRNAQRLMRERLSWDRTIEPLDRFVRRPRLRANALSRAGQPALAPARHARYLVSMAWAVLRHQGLRALMRDTWAFLRRQRGIA